jgi:hypothetical protein
MEVSSADGSERSEISDSIMGYGCDDFDVRYSDQSSSREYDVAMERWIFIHPHPSSRFIFSRPTRVQLVSLSATDAKMEDVSRSRNIQRSPLAVEAKVEIEWKFGGDEGSKFEVQGSGRVSDDNGNSATVSVKHESEGGTTVGVSVETKKD